MRKLNKAITLLLCAAMAISITGCTEEESGASKPVTTAAKTTTNTLDDDKKNPVDISALVDEPVKTLENPNITYFGYYDMRTAGDIKPTVKLFEATYGGKIDFINVTWGERVEKLQSLISSGDSPDLVDYESSAFPFLMSKGVYEDLTDYIDLSQPQWEGFQSLINQYSWNGKHFYYPWHATALTDYLFYNKTLFNEYGLDDPREMYDAGKWDWNTMKESMVNFIDSSNGKAETGIYGIVTNDIICSSGTPVVGMDENGKLVNNMSSQNVERAVNFLESLRRENLSKKEEGYYGNEIEPIAVGKAAFLSAGQWIMANFIKSYPEIELGFVPSPKDPNSDKYNYLVSTFGYMVPKGSENVAGAAAFIDMIRASQTDDEMKAIAKESIMTANGISSEAYDFMYTFNDIGKFDVVVNVADGFDSDTVTIIYDMLNNITFEQGENQQSWTSLRTSYEAIVNDTIAQYN